MLLVYLAGVLAFAGGDRTAGLVDNPWFVGGVAFGWLALITAANIRGLGVGKWINNIGGVGGMATVVLVAIAAAVARWTGTATTPVLVQGTGFDMAGALGVMCFAFIGIELASTMSDEIRHPERDVPRSIVITGVIALVAYLLVADALIALVPPGELGAIQGVMQAVHQGADAAGASWLVAPIAIVMALSVGGSASAWFAGPSRIPFVAGLDHALPAALGRVHPKWGSPYVALITCGRDLGGADRAVPGGIDGGRGVSGAAAGGGGAEPGAVRLCVPGADDAGHRPRFRASWPAPSAPWSPRPASSPCSCRQATSATSGSSK